MKIYRFDTMVRDFIFDKVLCVYIYIYIGVVSIFESHLARFKLVSLITLDLDWVSYSTKISTETIGFRLVLD